MNIKNIVIVLLIASQTCPLFCIAKIQQKPSSYAPSNMQITPRMLVIGAGIGAAGYFLYKKHQLNKILTLEMKKLEARREQEQLFYGCLVGSLQMVEDALNNGVDVNIINEGGETPLIRATICCSYEIVKTLLERDADCMIQNAENRMAWDYAKLSSQEEILRLIEENATKKFFEECYDLTYRRFSVSDEIMQKYVDAGVKLDEKYFFHVHAPVSLRDILKSWDATDIMKVDVACTKRDSRIVKKSSSLQISHNGTATIENESTGSENN